MTLRYTRRAETDPANPANPAARALTCRYIRVKPVPQTPQPRNQTPQTPQGGLRGLRGLDFPGQAKPRTVSRHSDLRVAGFAGFAGSESSRAREVRAGSHPAARPFRGGRNWLKTYTSGAETRNEHDAGSAVL